MVLAYLLIIVMSFDVYIWVGELRHINYIIIHTENNTNHYESTYAENNNMFFNRGKY